VNNQPETLISCEKHWIEALQSFFGWLFALVLAIEGLLFIKFPLFYFTFLISLIAFAILLFLISKLLESNCERFRTIYTFTETTIFIERRKYHLKTVFNYHFRKGVLDNTPGTFTRIFKQEYQLKFVDGCFENLNKPLVSQLLFPFNLIEPKHYTINCKYYIIHDKPTDIVIMNIREGDWQRIELTIRRWIRNANVDLGKSRR
jgi:hypothetical protein